MVIAEKGLDKLKTIDLLISNNRLSRTENSGACLNMEIYQQVTKYCEKGDIAPKELSPLFHNIFNISLISRAKLHIHLWKGAVGFIFFLILHIWHVEIRIYRSISELPLELEIMRIDCRLSSSFTRETTCWSSHLLSCTSRLFWKQIQSKFNDSNIFGTLGICSRDG